MNDPRPTAPAELPRARGVTAEGLPHGRKVVLRHLRDDHVPALHRLVMQPEVRATWRSRGEYWSPGDLQHRLAADPHLALVIEERGTGAVLGVAELHDLDLVDARAHLAIVTDPSTWASGVAVEAGLLFLGHVFDALPLEKVAVMVQATNDRARPGLARVLPHEGTLRRHLNIHGRWIDVDLFAVWRRDLPDLERRFGLERPVDLAPRGASRG